MHKILSVDDEPINQAIVEELFSTTFDVILASSGEECLQNIDSIKPDLILLDVSMVGMDGYETCRELKKDEKTRNIPIIFVSARGSLEDKIKAYDAGGYDYIIKPFNHSELEIRIEDTINSVKQYDKTLDDKATSAVHHHEEAEIIIQFLSACCADTSVDNLGELLINFCRDLELNCVVQFKHGSTISNFSTKSQISPLEKSLFEQTSSMERFFDFDSKTIISYPHVSLLINNMPIDNANRYKDLKDLLGVLLSGAESRTKSLMNEMTLIHQHEAVFEIIRNNLWEFGQHSGLSTEELINTIQSSIKKLSD